MLFFNKKISTSPHSNPFKKIYNMLHLIYMDLQTILVFILAVLTINLIIVGIYIVLVLKEFRETVKKANYVLDNVNEFTDHFVSPVTTIASIISGVTESVKAVKKISSLMDKDSNKSKKEDNNKDE